jgi:hypothetical protein
LRFKSRSASAKLTLARETSACSATTLARWVSTVARAASRSAMDWFTRREKESGSMRAMIWSFFTGEL